MQPSVYLAGPISGLSYGGCTNWRDHATKVLARRNIRGWSPMRAKDALKELATISGHGNEYAHMGPFATARGVMTRDYFDCTRTDVCIVNFCEAQTISIGTVMEIAWCYQARTPVILACPKGTTQHALHDHMMVNEAIGFHVETLDEALNVAIAILS